MSTGALEDRFGTRTASPTGINSPTISLVQPRTNNAKETARLPMMMTGLRRPPEVSIFQVFNYCNIPHWDSDLSAMAPTIGWHIIPDIGPTFQTRLMSDLVSPRDKRYGAQSIY